LKVFENSVVRRIFGPKRAKTVRGLRKFHYGELDKLYSSPNIIRMIKSRRMRRSGHVVCMGEKGSAQTVLVTKLKEGGHYKDMNLGRRIILKCILE
jgi:hypothetical protein